jgi:DNA (cytosine-5)-methyltransferase 1
MTHASLCSGIGAAELAATWLGWQNAFWCEIDPFCRRVLKYWFKESRGYEDIRKTDFREWSGKIDVLSAGFPCQPFSTAGQRKGADDDRYLWPEIIRVIREVQPTWFIGENVAGITSMVQLRSEANLETWTDAFGKTYTRRIRHDRYIIKSICEDIKQNGYTVQPVVIPACAVGAPHRRDRIFLIAHRADTGIESLQFKRENGVCEPQNAADAVRTEFQGAGSARSGRNEFTDKGKYAARPAGSRRIQDNEKQPSEQFAQNIPDWRDFPTQSPVCRGNDGLPDGLAGIPVSRWRRECIKAFGNAIVPQVIYEIFKAINETNNL